MIPFITAELYQALMPNTEHADDVGYASYPIYNESLVDQDAEKAFSHLQAATTAVRNLRNEAGIPPSQTVPVQISGEAAGVVGEYAGVLETLAKAKLVTNISGASISQVATCARGNSTT